MSRDRAVHYTNFINGVVNSQYCLQSGNTLETVLASQKISSLKN